MSEPKYKWIYPGDWLNDKLQDQAEAAIAVDVDALVETIMNRVGVSPRRETARAAMRQELNRALDPVSDAVIRLRDYARACAQLLDSDTVQDTFRQEMSDDGYFEQIKDPQNDED